MAPALDEKQVHTWWVVWPVQHQLQERGCEILSAEERERSTKFHFQNDRNRFVATQSILRILLGRYLDTSATDLRFVTNDFGKPRLPTSDHAIDIRFNMSHSGNAAMYAFAIATDVGIDVERIREASNMAPVSKRCLSEDQFASFETLDDAARTHAFFKFWTRKEALIKALGTGLSQPLKDFDVSFRDSEPPQLIRAASGFGDVNDWTLTDLPAPETYRAALAIHGNGFGVKSFEFADDGW